MAKFKVVIVFILTAMVINYLNVPVPEDLPGWWKTKLWLGIFKLVYSLPTLGSKLGIDEGMLLQSSLGLLIKMVPRPLAAGVTRIEARFNELPVELYRPPEDELTGRGLIYYHGGGWVISQSDFYPDQLSRVAKELGAVVAYVHYRTAPEHPFPAAIEDCMAAYKYFVEHSEEFKVDPTRIGVFGDSAGGNLAAAVSVYALQTGYTPKPKLQLLFYPVLQGSNLHTPSYEANKDGPFLTSGAMAFFFAAYIFGTDYQKYESIILNNNHTSPEEKKLNAKEYLTLKALPDDELKTGYKENLDFGDSVLWEDIKHKFRNPLFAPIYAANVNGITPAYINTCKYDVLRDDGFYYAKRLKDANVRVEHHQFPCFHTWLLLQMFVPEYHDEFSKAIDYMAKNI